MDLTDARQHYKPRFFTMRQIEEDLAAFTRIKRASSRYLNGANINPRRVMNDLITLFNQFDDAYIKKMLWLECSREQFIIVNTHLHYMKRTYDTIHIDMRLLNEIEEFV